MRNRMIGQRCFPQNRDWQERRWGLDWARSTYTLVDPTKNKSRKGK
jgi:hypothetical protein